MKLSEQLRDDAQRFMDAIESIPMKALVAVLYQRADRAAKLEKELVVRSQACLVDCFDIEMMDGDMAKQLLHAIARAEIEESE